MITYQPSSSPQRGAQKCIEPITSKDFLSQLGSDKTTLTCRKNHLLFSQGDAADAVFYILTGKVSLTVVSHRGKEVVAGILERASFVGESCLAGERLRIATATTLGASTIVRIDKQAMIRLLHKEPAFAERFTSYLLCRNLRIEGDLVHQLFNSTEKQLARALLLMAHFGKEGQPDRVIPKVSHDALAEMIGTTRSEVSGFLQKFKRQGFIAYKGGMNVHSSLLNIVLHD